MTIEDILVTTLGAVLARLLLLRWIGSSDIAEELTGGIKDLIAQVVSGRRNQHKAERVFLEIGEGIAESLGVVFSAEGVDFSDERKQFIAKAVAETIPNITADTALRNMLLKYDLQADLFAKDLISRYPHRQVLDPSEHELYRRIVQESCRRLLEVTASLPNFDLEVFSDLLKNSHHLINLAEESLLRVNHLYNDALTHARGKILQERRFEHTYRQSVVQKLDFVELLGLDVRARSSYRQPLTVAYITLKLQGEDLTSSGVDAPEALATARRVLITGEAGSGKTTLLKWIAVRTANSDFQSTAVEMEKWGEGIPFYIQLREFARMDTPLPPPEEWPRLVSPHIVETMPPRWVHEQLEIGRATVLIDGLDELSQEKRLDTYNWLNDIMMTYYKSRYVITSRPEAIQDEWLYIGFQDFRLSDRFIDEFIDKWNAEIDNILNEDEDESPSRELQIELLRKLAKEFQDEGRKEIGSILGYEPMFINASFIVSKMVWDARTGRTREAHIDILRTYLDNIQDQWQQQLKKEWIRLLSVQRMSNQDVTKFIEQWHSSVAEAEGGLASQHKQLALVAAHFNEELNEHSALRELAATPLLCAMLCALHRERKQELPRDRINLYRACLDTMLRKRDEKTGVDLTDYPLLGKKQMRYLLKDLAYWMMRNDYMALAPKQMVIKRLDGRLSQLIGIESITGNDILKYFVDRTGILRELAVDQIDFAHRTFQEFLCAEAIALEGDIRAVSTYLTQTEWHEVIVLASGLVSQQELAWLLSKMLSTSITSIFRDGTAKTRLNWLALECLSTEPILNEEAQKAIDKHLAKVRPPRSLREAQIMSKAKELALPYLGYSEEYTDTTTLYIIETLTLIGGNEALAKLVQFMPSLQARFTRGTPKKKPGGGPVISVHFGITGKLLLEPFGVIPSTKWGSPQSVSAIRADVPHFVRNSSIAQIELRLYKAWALWDMSEVFARQILQPLVDKTKYLFLEHAQWLNLAFEYLDLSGVEHIEFEGYDNTQNWDDIVNRLWDLSYLSQLSFACDVNIYEIRSLENLPRVLQINVPKSVIIPKEFQSAHPAFKHWD